MNIKLCMLGAFGVGKTSLVRRYVYKEFSDSFSTTLGVKVEEKTIEGLSDEAVDVRVWDTHGGSRLGDVERSYLGGVGGYLLVVDVSRPETMDVAGAIADEAKYRLPEVPFVALLNKCDLTEYKDELVQVRAKVEELGWKYYQTSAKKGENVSTAFEALARLVLDGNEIAVAASASE